MNKEEIKHYGTPRHSGRYPWGSGKDPEQRGKTFSGRVNELKKQGVEEKDIAKGFGMSIKQVRAKISVEKDEAIKNRAATAYKLKQKGYSNAKIADMMGEKGESSVRALLKPRLKERAEITKVTTDMLRENVEKHRMLDVGIGVERHLGVSRTKLQTALNSLEEEGYKLHTIKTPQLGTTHETKTLVLTKPEVTFKEVATNQDKIKLINHYTEDGGRSWQGLEPIRSISSKRILVRYKEDGGKDRDGVIELRRGVDELSLGQARYAQVRIGVDDTHYLKGMAMYCDDAPKGIDVIYNTNKKKGTPKEDVFKSMETDKDGNILKDNPFGSTVRQRHYLDSSGKKQLSAINVISSNPFAAPEQDKINEEGRWIEWSKNLSSQMLSKQAPALAKKQLDLYFDAKKKDFDEINTLTNPAIKKKLLIEFADNCDAASVHLKAAAMPRQATHVILPFPKMKETEIYAPNYDNGERVVLIRHPHGGLFEIPELTVNNKQPDAVRLIKGAKDAVGIHPSVAERLSGADFDGDTVLVIPNKKGSKFAIKTKPPIPDLLEFDTREAYPPYDGMKTIDGGIYDAKQKKVIYTNKPKKGPKELKMGDVSNLITDMTIKGAPLNEIARAVKHSMVVIDSEKHHLDYKRSYEEQGIAALKKRYQGKASAGASTLVSKASSEKRIPQRQDYYKIDPKTGKKIYRPTNKSFINKEGKLVQLTTKTTKMAEEEDAFKLSSGTLIETVYAAHANKLKGLANQSRKISENTKTIPYSPSANKTYAPEVAALTAHLNIALKNAPLERQAQRIANSIVAAKKKDNPDLEVDKDALKKIKGQVLTEARLRVGAKKETIKITDKQWEAIQAGAITNNTLTKIINNADNETLKQLATPRKRSSKTVSSVKLDRAKAMLKAGRTQAEVAKALGISRSMLTEALESN